ncbi:hypothetical protein [uncultured Alistipes sp.]|jgi:hypothetical protein|uniref:hypothetical protein n=1 Tax=uncultured Alistipes sp. TaxID=538949 RepID=UPI0025EC009E|nr:hypothetical protein [uncultured Alistipes sp.]
MEKLINLISICVAAALLGACTAGYADGGVADGTRGLMSVEVLTPGAAEEDHVRTARFITFDNASTFAKIDVNELITLDPKDQDATRFKTMLEVSCNPDKMLFVIVNEPASLTALLGGVILPSQLEDLTFRMADAFNANHTGILATGLPMSGMTRGVAVTEANKSEDTAAQAEVGIRRAVARVELWLKTDERTAASLTSATTVTLSKSHDRGYLFGPDTDNSFGWMPTVDDPATSVTWSYTGTDPLYLTETVQPICAFYTPERTCTVEDNIDKLVLDIQGIEAEDGVRNAQTVLSQFTSGGITKTITRIERNNIYKIVGRVREMEFDHSILPWNDENQGIVIDPQYYLRMSRDNLYLPENGYRETIAAETNYDRDDRGFARGIRLGDVAYYDKNDQKVEPAAGNLHGWLAVTADGADGDLTRNIEFSVTKALDAGDKGCYAKAEVKAGNLTKLVKVNR